MGRSRFIGIDLAWQSQSNPTGAAVFAGDRGGAELRAVTGTLRSLDSILNFVFAHEGDEAIVAIDAPLIISNDNGQRLCETLVSRKYGSRHASCHSSNRTRYPNAASVRLAETLSARGYRHPVGSPSARVMLEVYPHPALIELFALPSILRYKKGLVSTRAQGLARLQELIQTLATAEPAFRPNVLLSSLLATQPDTLSGAARKELEDSLDAVVCAYIAFHFWYWQGKRTTIFGNESTGYIAIPHMESAGATCASV